MNEFDELVVSAHSPDEFVTAFLRVMPMVPKDTRRRLKHIMMTIVMRQGDHAMFDRFNGHSIAQILEGARDIPDAQPIVSGEVDGLRYEVFERPASENNEKSEPSDI